MTLVKSIPSDPTAPFHGTSDPVLPVTRLPAPSARWRMRHVALLLSGLVCVLLPVLLSAWYLWARAADQYASEAGFAVRREETGAAVEMLGGLAGLSGASSRDTDILYEYLGSRRLVAELEAGLGLSALWSIPGTKAFRGETDPVFAFDADGSLEALHAYWPRRVQVSYDSLAGLIELRVTAFAPDDAQRIADGIVARATALINEMSDVAQADAVRDAAAELEAAETRLRLARAEVTLFRNRHQLVDPAMDLQAQAGLLGTLQAQLAEALIALDLLREATRADDPRLEQGARRVAVIEARIAAERAKLGLEGDGAAFADVVGAYEALVADRDFAERAYAAARGAYDLAQAEARRQSRYLAAWQAPTLPETAEYPQRARLLALVAGFAALLWALAALSVYAALDRRG
ncbi:capsule biosynthesis protein [Marivita hallyeonensis]|uniref:Capsular polysaccharide transport system permease protein n=1 Tax=Marivita hallyeonensis TaxID=996342 RepID=A0A1M5Y6D3_9RHOB|nr:capsule biosynthesis protein [Marivita hallyeonensis]SHI07532.1 capsular polysaccharide transport system permease protein [Marivita hallyeonensis]